MEREAICFQILSGDIVPCGINRPAHIFSSVLSVMFWLILIVGLTTISDQGPCSITMYFFKCS